MQAGYRKDYIVRGEYKTIYVCMHALYDKN